ncbi:MULTISPECIES: sporulation protein YqfD [Anaerostipes]|uniref:sporulation protein YqfD n=1 Tax=Anaerostipes TaxID=207244 RepID=UPI0011DDA38C|nr:MULTISPECIES: sporulation protein YqfD [Anaerostipes]
MVRLIQYFFGSIFLEISGPSVERFLNLCAKQNLVLWNLKPGGNGYQCSVQKRAYETVLALAEKTGTSVRILGRKGLPFFLLEHRKRKVFFFGIGMALVLMFLMSQFIWEITVSGNERYSKSDMLKYVKSNFYQIGTYKKKIDCNLLEEHIREDHEGIAWVSCSINGTRLHIDIKESLDRKTKQNPRKPCDIVSNKKGTITSMSVKSGTPLVQVGDKVKRGDTLISGMIYYYSDDYQVTETSKIKADGQIILRIKEDYKETIPIATYEKKFISKSTRVESIQLLNWQLKLPIKEQKGDYDVLGEKKLLHIGDLYFPIGITTKKFEGYEPKRRVLTEAQAQDKLKKRLSAYVNDKKKKGIKVIKTNIQYERQGNDYIAKGTIDVEEPVGKIRNIKSLTKKQVEKITPTTAAPQ